MIYRGLYCKKPKSFTKLTKVTEKNLWKENDYE
nr:MAG TPA: hypothetical protein [Caudoviricetes sp.]